MRCANDQVEIRVGDCLELLRQMPDQSVHCVVTSPPYWGALRDYGMPGQLGMERDPSAFVVQIVSVFQEVRRVLRKDGCLWLNMGDTYAAGGRGGGGSLTKRRAGKWDHRVDLKGWRKPPAGFKQKDLVGIPWRVAIALQADGWTLRRDVVWNKFRATEPTRADRPIGSHEFLFLFSKGTKYHFDSSELPQGSVWGVSPEGYDGHSAAFPPKLIEPCILAGCPKGGTVLDPFGGAGTTGLVAARHGRRAILLELNPEYAVLAHRRISEEWREPVEQTQDDEPLPLFGGAP